MGLSRVMRAGAAAACAGGVLLMAACNTSTADPAAPTTSVPRSAAVTVPPGPVTRTPTGTHLAFGQTAVLPANAFDATGPLAMYTVTGITAGEDVPDKTVHDGTAYFIYVTVTSLSPRPAPAPGVVGLAGSPDGRRSTLVMNPPDEATNCVTTNPPAQMRHGESYATCVMAVADKGEKLPQVIYAADTSADESFDYKSAPVVWSKPNEPSGSSSAPAPATTPAG